MLRITVNILCQDGYSEVFPEADYTESFLEGLVTLRLMEFFEFIKIEGVSVTCVSVMSTGRQICLLSLDASGQPLSSDAPDVLELRLEDALCCALIELFSRIHVLTLHVCHEEEVAQAALALPSTSDAEMNRATA